MLGSLHSSVGLGTLWTNEDFGLPRVTGLHRQGQIPSQGRHICSSVEFDCKQTIFALFRGMPSRQINLPGCGIESQNLHIAAL